MAPTNAVGGGVDRTGFFGHPRGLRTLFFTEMWERFSYYGMRALLVLFMVAAVQRGGLGLDDATATAIYGIYTGAVYLLALPGGWMADRWLGARRAVWWGGVIITAGHGTLALPGFIGGLPERAVFYAGLGLIVVGTGLLKPNISAMVGRLYPEGGARRDAGFSIFYMGINLGAMLGPLVCSYLGETIRWHYGFGAAGVGMALGLVVYRWTERGLGDIGRAPDPSDGGAESGLAMGRWVVGALVGGCIGWFVGSRSGLDAVGVARWMGVAIVVLAVWYFAWVLAAGGLTPEERRRVVVLAVFFVGSAVFWSGFEQAGSTLNLFAERYTDRSFLGGQFPGGQHPAGYYQSVNALFIILGAPVFAALWVGLARRQLEPSAPLKFAFGLLLLAVGFGVMAVAAWLMVRDGGKALPTWLIATYFFHTCGELCLSPIGLSWVTKLAPARYVGRMMGTWFMATSLGNLLGGLVAGYFGEGDVGQMPRRFALIVATTAGVGLVIAAVRKPLQRMMGAVR